MYKIYADDMLIYDSTVEDYKIDKGSITLEINKSGSFTFSLYPDHFYYDEFVKMKTVIRVYKDGSIIFRGRILNDTVDYYNNKVLTCEGEMGFLNDSIIRPFAVSGTPEELFTKFVSEHNAQVDEFKQFKIGTVTVTDENNYIARENTGFETTLSNMNSRLVGDSTGGYFSITHDGNDPIPTIHYLADFETVASQKVEFGENLKDYAKTAKADEIATAIIPIGASIDVEVGTDEEGNPITEQRRVMITDVNGGTDYVYSESGVALRGWIFKTVTWDDVTDAATLKTKAEAYVENAINQNITIELTAIDLHFIDKNIRSINVGDYVHVISAPHNFDSVMLCNKQTIDLLKPENDSFVLGASYATFTEKTNKTAAAIAMIPSLQSNVVKISNSASNAVAQVNAIGQTVSATAEQVGALDENIKTLSSDFNEHTHDADDIISGILPILRGGTGATSKRGAANNLFETGTWTPVLKGYAGTTDPTYTTTKGYNNGTGRAVGQYIRIGRFVFVYCAISAQISDAGDGYALVGGLPFTPYTDSALNLLEVYNCITMTATTEHPVLRINIAANGVLIKYPNGSATYKWKANSTAGGCLLTFSGMYVTAN